MARIRSPDCPAVTLEQAIDLTEKIFCAHRTNAIQKAHAVRHMGYSGLTGPTLKLLGALNQYGLLEEVAKGKVRVSKKAALILQGLDENERRQGSAENSG